MESIVFCRCRLMKVACYRSTVCTRLLSRFLLPLLIRGPGNHRRWTRHSCRYCRLAYSIELTPSFDNSQFSPVYEFLSSRGVVKIGFTKDAVTENLPILFGVEIKKTNGDIDEAEVQLKTFFFFSPFSNGWSILKSSLNALSTWQHSVSLFTAILGHRMWPVEMGENW